MGYTCRRTKNDFKQLPAKTTIQYHFKLTFKYFLNNFALIKDNLNKFLTQNAMA